MAWLGNHWLVALGFQHDGFVALQLDAAEVHARSRIKPFPTARGDPRLDHEQDLGIRRIHETENCSLPFGTGGRLVLIAGAGP